MATVLYAPLAFSDLERLANFLEQTDPGAAESTLERIFSAIEMLASHPLVGRSAEHELRELVISRGRTGYVALYRYDEVRDRVLVLGIRHQREAGYA